MACSQSFPDACSAPGGQGSRITLNREGRIDLEIAVVGMAGRFPGAPSIAAFWQNLRGGVESIRDLSEEDLRAAGLSADILADARLVKRAADLSNVDLFDAG